MKSFPKHWRKGVFNLINLVGILWDQAWLKSQTGLGKSCAAIKQSAARAEGVPGRIKPHNQPINPAAAAPHTPV